jgi:hypothetical protein
MHDNSLQHSASATSSAMTRCVHSDHVVDFTDPLAGMSGLETTMGTASGNYEDIEMQNSEEEWNVPRPEPALFVLTGDGFN